MQLRDSESLFSVKQIRALENQLFAQCSASEIMARAAVHLSLLIRMKIKSGSKLNFAIGAGNNARDAMLCAVLLAKTYHCCLYLKNFNGLQHDNVLQDSLLQLVLQKHLTNKEARLTIDLLIKNAKSLGELDLEQNQASLPKLKPEIWIDGLYGIGLSRKLLDEDIRTIDTINQRATTIIAVDAPSGLNCDLGNDFGKIISADYTLTFIGKKIGMALNAHCGQISLAKLDKSTARLGSTCPGLFTNKLRVDETHIRQLNYFSLQGQVAKRKGQCHKSSFGRLGLLGGASEMRGALAISSTCAVELGAGMVYCGFIQDQANIDSPLKANLAPQVIGCQISACTNKSLARFADCNCLAVGMGLGQSELAREIVTWALSTKLPLILDADGLNLLAQQQDLAKLSERSAAVILTPHLKECARLLNIPIRAVKEDMLGAAQQLAKLTGQIVVLKNTRSIIVKDNEQGSFCLVNATGNAILATAGSGDGLSGLIASLLAQKTSAEMAAIGGVWLAGQSADLLARQGCKRGLDFLQFARTAKHILARQLAQ